MKRIISISLATFLVLAFQNCAKQQLSTQDGALSASQKLDSTPPSAKIDSTIDLSQVETISIPNDMGLAQSGYSHVSDPAGEFIVETQTGLIKAIGSNGQELKQKFCLSDDETDELRNILDTGKVCLGSNEVPDGMMCTMAYQMPYVALSIAGEEVHLGSASNGCVKPTDLCGDHAKMLRGFVTNLLANIESKKCN